MYIFTIYIYIHAYVNIIYIYNMSLQTISQNRRSSSAVGDPQMTKVAYCRANGISMVPKLIGQAPAAA